MEIQKSKIKEIQAMLESESPKERAVGKGMLLMYLDVASPALLDMPTVGCRYTVTFISWNMNKTESKLHKHGSSPYVGTPHIKERPMIFGGIENRKGGPCLVCTMDHGGCNRRWYRVKDILMLELATMELGEPLVTGADIMYSMMDTKAREKNGN